MSSRRDPSRFLQQYLEEYRALVAEVVAKYTSGVFDLDEWGRDMDRAGAHYRARLRNLELALDLEEGATADAPQGT